MFDIQKGEGTHTTHTVQEILEKLLGIEATKRKCPPIDWLFIYCFERSCITSVV